MTSTQQSRIMIRPAQAADADRITVLAALDSAARPARPLMLGEVDGELRVAVSLADGAVVADPFVHTAELVELVRAHAAAVGRPAAARVRSGGAALTWWRPRARAAARGRGALA